MDPDRRSRKDLYSRFFKLMIYYRSFIDLSLICYQSYQLVINERSIVIDERSIVIDQNIDRSGITNKDRYSRFFMAKSSINPLSIRHRSVLIIDHIECGDLDCYQHLKMAEELRKTTAPACLFSISISIVKLAKTLYKVFKGW